MQPILYLDYPSSFDSNRPMSVQLREERLKLFHNKKERVFIDVKEHKILLAALLYLGTTFERLAYEKATKYNGRNYDLYAIVRYLVSRKLYTLSYLQKYVFTERKLQNYRRQLLLSKDQEKYTDLFNYLDTLL